MSKNPSGQDTVTALCHDRTERIEQVKQEIAEKVLFEQLTALHADLTERIAHARQRMFEIDLDDPVAVIKLTRQMTEDKTLCGAVNDMLRNHESGKVTGNWMREWLIARDLIHVYGDTVRNWGGPNELPLSLRLEYQIEMLRTKIPACKVERPSDAEQLRRGNALAVVQTRMTRKAFENAAQQLELFRAAA